MLSSPTRGTLEGAKHHGLRDTHRCRDGRYQQPMSVDRLFTDKASGKETRRPELERLLTFVRGGDTVVVHSMDRLARNLDDLRRLVYKLTLGGVQIVQVRIMSY